MTARLLAVLAVLLAGGATAPAPSHADPAAPAQPPIAAAVLRGFEPPAHPYGAGHRGAALAAAPGAEVRAAMAGRVAFAGRVARVGWVTVDHGGGLDTTYGPLDPRLVRDGQQVRQGAVIGRLAAGASHLHWGARLHGIYIDPLTLLGRWEVHLAPHP